MFKNWGFLLAEIWFLIVLAALLGLFVGWLLWGGRRKTSYKSSGDEAGTLRAQLEDCRASCREKDDLIGRLEGRLEGRGAAKEARPATPAKAAAPANLAVMNAPVAERASEGVKPKTLDAPLEGKADNLKKIKGVGPKLEKLCNRLGFWHFDQIANWTDAEVAWVDANLEGFKGRVTRDDWVAQAKLLAEGRTTEFSKRVEAGDVYEKDKK